MTALCHLLDGLLCGESSKVDWTSDTTKLHPLICTTFLFCYVWCMGGNLVQKSLELFETFVRDAFAETHDVKVLDGLLYHYTVHVHVNTLYMYMYMCICL